MLDRQSCSKCSYVAPGKQTKCPQCGSWIRGAQRIRRLGIVLIILGIFLVLFMGGITLFTAPIMLSSGSTSGGTSFSGTPEQAILILGLFGMVIVFGFAAILAGVFQIITGRRSIWIIIAILVLTFLLVAVAGVVRQSLEGGRSRGAVGTAQQPSMQSRVWSRESLVRTVT